MELISLRTAMLVDVARQKHHRAYMRVLRAVHHMLSVNEPMSVNNVAKTAGVATSTIYDNDDLLYIIRFYASQFQNLPVSSSTYFEDKEFYSTGAELDILSIPAIHNLQEWEKEIMWQVDENRALCLKLLELKAEEEKYKNRRLCDISDSDIFPE